MPSGNLESWLSHLATPAPFLSELEQLYNAAIAEELAELIVEEIARSQMQTLERPIPHRPEGTIEELSSLQLHKLHGSNQRIAH
jgi:hypothetical protein